MVEQKHLSMKSSQVASSKAWETAQTSRNRLARRPRRELARNTRQALQTWHIVSSKSPHPHSLLSSAETHYIFFFFLRQQGGDLLCYPTHQIPLATSNWGGIHVANHRCASTNWVSKDAWPSASDHASRSL